MKSTMQVRLAGTGGQGVILGSIILAEAAIEDNKSAIQSQSYGPEARGGMCKGEVIISSEEIDFPKVEEPDVLLAMSQASLDKYAAEVGPDCLIIADSSLIMPKTNGRIISIPILHTAQDVVKNKMTANIVAISAINNLLKFVPKECLEKAVMKYVPKSSYATNQYAIEEGIRITEGISI